MPNQLTPESSSYVFARNRTAQAMALRLGQTGSSRWTQEVLEFQIIWNETRAVTREQLQIIGLSFTQANAIAKQLAEDGLYGTSTSGALYAIVSDPRPPSRASGMPAWVAANQSTINALVAPSNPPVDDLIDPWAGEVDTNPQVQPSSGGQIVVDIIDGTTTSGPETPGAMPPVALDVVCDQGMQLPAGCAWDQAGGFQCSSTVSAQDLYGMGCETNAQYDARVARAAQQPGTMPGPVVDEPAPIPFDAEILEVLHVEDEIDPMSLPSDVDAFPHVISTVRTSSKVPGVAIVLGVGVLGGAFWWMTKGRKRRRAA